MTRDGFLYRLLFLIALHLIAVPGALAAPGALDPSFNGSGVALFSGQAYANEGGRSIALQPDGRIVVVGQVDNGTDKDILVTRYNSDGTLDATFGSGGSVSYDGGYNDVGNAVAIQADGKIVVGGQTYNGAYDDVVVLRYLSDGTPDDSFGPGGATFYGGGWQTSQVCNALAVQADGRIIAAGVIRDLMGNEDTLLLRFKSDGRLDDNFGFDGVTVYDSFGNESAAAVVVQPDGKIVIAGSTRSGGSDDVLLIRYNSDGTSMDATFGGNGTGVVRYGGGVSEVSATALALGADGKLVVAGYLHNGSDTDMLVLRYDSAGALDGTFGNGGVKTYDSGRSDYARGVVVQGDGKIVVAGTQHNGSDEDMAILRYNADGSADGAFGTAGRLVYNSGHGDQLYALALQGDGRIVAAGWVENGSAYDLVLLRATAGGSLDASFAGDGVAVNDSTFATLDYAYAVALQSDGKVLVAGERMGDVLLLRYTPLGVLDAGFGSGGVVTYDSGRSDAAYGVAVQEDGKIVVAGSSMGQANHDVLLLRYNGDGTLDTGFGTAGVVTYEAGGDDTGYAVALQPDGKIVVAGSGGNMFGTMSLLIRFNADGTPDAGFGTAGLASYDGGGFDNAGYAVTVLPGGKISLAGYSLGRLLLLRYLGDGTLDPSYGSGGIVGPDHGRSEYGTYGTVGPDGKGVVVGYAFNDVSGRYDLVVVRFDSSGAPDTAFGAAGVVTVAGAVDYYPFGVAIQPNGKILVTGNTHDPGNATDRLFVLRLDGSGTPDTTFGSNGWFTYSGGSHDYGFALALQADGRIVVTGSSVQQDDDILTLRLQGAAPDLSPPLLTVSAPSADLTTDRQNYLISGTASDDLGPVTVMVTVDGTTYIPLLTGGAFQQAVSFPGEGTYPVVVTATDGAGNSTTLQRSVTYVRWGDVDGGGGVTAGDALLALRYLVGLVPLAPAQMSRCDVAPVVNGTPQPNGTIDISDVLLILRKAVGLGW